MMMMMMIMLYNVANLSFLLLLVEPVCGLISNAENGRLHYELVDGRLVALHTCSRVYFKRGKDQKICYRNGSWVGDFLPCGEYYKLNYV